MIWNLAELELAPDDDPAPDGHRFTFRSVRREAGAKLTGLSVFELEPGEGSWPYHFEIVDEEWLIVVGGEVTLRTPDGERVLRAGEVACFPAGPAGAHAVRNTSGAVARFAMPSTVARIGDGAVYPDSGKFVLKSRGFEHRGFLGDAAEYWEGEA